MLNYIIFKMFKVTINVTAGRRGIDTFAKHREKVEATAKIYGKYGTQVDVAKVQAEQHKMENDQ